jgi:hypothetical protein
MKSAKDLKEKGNESLLHKHDFYEAIHFYENAMSLFHWIVNKKENWKKQEIEDDMLEMFEYQPAEETERKEIQELKCSCLLNFALASQKLFQWSDRSPPLPSPPFFLLPLLLSSSPSLTLSLTSAFLVSICPSFGLVSKLAQRS